MIPLQVAEGPGRHEYDDEAKDDGEEDVQILAAESSTWKWNYSVIQLGRGSRT